MGGGGANPMSNLRNVECLCHLEKAMSPDDFKFFKIF